MDSHADVGRAPHHCSWCPMTDPDFFAAMAVGIPPIKAPVAPAPVWIGIDLANGPDTRIEVGRAADGTVYAINQEQSP